MYQSMPYAAYVTAGFAPIKRNFRSWKRRRAAKKRDRFNKRIGEVSLVSNESIAAIWPQPPVPFASGTLKQVYRGHYRDGPRKGQECVSKTFTIRSKAEDDLFEDELRICQQAKSLIKWWNMARIIDLPVVLSVPEDWWVCTGADTYERRLVEPFIDNFEKFSHDRDSTGPQNEFWSDVLQALSHYSYHFSSGQWVLCDIRGGIHKKKFILSSPTILSTSQSYGVADLGTEGINAFFARHQCNRFCKSEWAKPQG